MPRVQVVLDALNRWEWVGILLARVAVGTLFLLSGEGKLFRSDRKERMRRTLREAGVPYPELNATVVSAVEFGFGFLLIVGMLTPLACLMLSGVMVVALATTQIPSRKASSASDWLAEFLYLPEVLYLVILVWLLLAGPGWLSVDHLIIFRTRL